MSHRVPRGCLKDKKKLLRNTTMTDHFIIDFTFLQEYVCVGADHKKTWQLEQCVDDTNTKERPKETARREYLKVTRNVIWNIFVLCLLHNFIQFILLLLIVFASVEIHGFPVSPQDKHTYFNMICRVNPILTYLASSVMPLFTSQWGVSRQRRITNAARIVIRVPNTSLDVLHERRAPDVYPKAHPKQAVIVWNGPRILLNDAWAVSAMKTPLK